VDAGVWVQLYTCGLALTVLDTLHTAAGARTLSGLKTSSYTAFLYARKIIFREEVPAGTNKKNRAQERELAETDEDPGSEADTESDGEEHPLPKRRKKTTGSTPDNKKPMELVRCCHCKKTWGPYNSSYTTTSAFKRHIEHKHRKIPFNELSEKAMIEEIQARVAAETGTAPQGSTPWTRAAQGALGRQPGQRFTASKYRELLAEFIVESSSSFRIVEYASFHRFVSYLNGNAPLISRETVRNDTAELKNRYQEKLLGEVQSHLGEQKKGRISLTMDVWTSSNQIPYLGVTGHWIDSSWEVRNEALAFKRLRGSHTAENIAAVVQKIMQEWKITPAIRAITADNAAVNDKFFTCLEKLQPTITRADTQVRCMAHVINLAAQTILRNLNAEAPDDGIPGGDGEDVPPAPFRRQQAARQHAPTVRAPGVILTTVRQVFNKVRSSNLLFEALEAQCNAKKIAFLRPIKDVKTRWNSTHALICRALELKPALKQLCSSDKRLRPFRLLGEEWLLLEDLRDLLKSFVTATEALSGGLYPTISFQLPYFAVLMQNLETFHDNHARQSPNSPLLAAASAGLAHLKKYMQDTDNFTTQKLAIILDPRFKIQGFTKMGWSPAAVGVTRARFESILEEQYQQDPVPTAGNSQLRRVQVDDNLASMFGSIGRRPEATRAQATMEGSETARYLCEPPVDLNTDPLHWWKLNEHRFPTVARMARDYLAICASSVPCERLFSA
jgi:hypothetical protein